MYGLWQQSKLFFMNSKFNVQKYYSYHVADVETTYQTQFIMRMFDWQNRRAPQYNDKQERMCWMILTIFALSN